MSTASGPRTPYVHTQPLNANSSAKNATASASRRRGGPGWLVVVGVVLLPVLEITALVAAGQSIGIWWTLALLVLMSTLGVWMMKREGISTWRSLRDAMAAGRVPGKEAADAGLVVVGGFLLLLPGFITDVIGLFLIVPFTRSFVRRALQRDVERRVMTQAGVVRSVIVQEERTAPQPREIPHIDLRRES